MINTLDARRCYVHSSERIFVLISWRY